MDNSQHTPGPWKAHFEEAYFVTGPDLGRVAMMMSLKGAYGLGGRRSGDESAANARLIAAAPELLEALQAWLASDRADQNEIVGRDDDGHALSSAGVARKKARAAIEKATGSTHE